MKTIAGRLTFTVAVLILLCYGCESEQQPGKVNVPQAPQARIQPEPAAKPSTATEAPAAKPATEAAKAERPQPAPSPKTGQTTQTEEPGVVARIGDYTITADELVEKVLLKLRRGEIGKSGRCEPAEVNEVLMEMLAEKAMLVQARQDNVLPNSPTLREMNENDLINMLLRKELTDKARQIKITESEIEQKIKSNPKLNKKNAELVLRREKVRNLVDRYYEQLRERRNVKLLKYNFPKAAQAHQRLLYKPSRQRRGYWIKRWQIEEELTPEEKQTPLATFDGGRVTIEDWFWTLHKMSPPDRPKNLDTLKGVEELLEKALRTSILVSQARAQGLDKDPAYVKKVRNREDGYILSDVRRKIYQNVEKPTDEEIAAYFEQHKEQFRRKDSVKIRQIWCKDLATARQAKAALDGGQSFESVAEQFSLRKDNRPATVTVDSEGIFFEQLWSAEPNDIVGPIKGFYTDIRRRQIGVKWRVVKIVQKKPGSERKLSKAVKQEVKGFLTRKRRQQALAEYGRELLKKHPYKIYTERLRKLDPLAVS